MSSPRQSFRIGIVCEHFCRGAGGAELWTRAFVRWLLGQGHDVHVVCRQERHHGGAFEGLTLHPIHANASPEAFADQAETLLKTLSVDVVHDMGAGHYFDILHLHGGSRLSAKKAIFGMYPPWLRPLKRMSMRLSRRSFQHNRLMHAQFRFAESKYYIALSRRIAAEFQIIHGVPTSRIRLVYNGVDANRFSPDKLTTARAQIREKLNIQSHEIVLLLVARNMRLKGVKPLMRAFHRLVGAGFPVRLVVVGGRKSKRTVSTARTGRVIYTGPQPDPVPYYAAADIYVHPSYYDACSLVVLEALAAGLPVVTTKINGASELYTDGIHGYVISHADDFKALIQSINDLMDRGQREKMSRAARELGAELSLRENFRNIFNIYLEVVRERRAR